MVYKIYLHYNLPSEQIVSDAIQVLKEYHGILDRHNLLLQACTSGAVTAREMDELKQAGLGACVLDGLPHWVIKYAAGIVCYDIPSSCFALYWCKVNVQWLCFDSQVLLYHHASFTMIHK